MQLKRLGIKNYRIIDDITIEIDKSLTLIVGRNNTGKTSLMKLLTTVLTGSKIKFNDYPINCRKKIYETFENFKNKNISFQDVQSAIPITSITMYIDYKDEKETDPLGFLSPFIIDTDINITEVKILIQYKFSISEQELFDLLNEEKDIPNVVKSNFFKFFSLQILAINPKDENDILLRTKEELSALLPIKTISAERGLDESEQKNETPLSPLLNRILGDNNIDDNEIKKNIEKLKQTISGVNNQFQKDVNKIISDIIQKSIVFGYPNTEEMQIFAETEIALDEEIKKNTNLSYCCTTDNRETLPDSYNGLGYKNLLKIILQLYEFANTINQNSVGSIPILYLEEPESHMHPQLQSTFVKYLDKFLKEISNSNIQVILTTHSSHIANTIPFQQIRYFKKYKNNLKCKDLSEFCDQNKDNTSFLQKYLNITRCDLFFADKAILIEGPSEKILLECMITNCEEEGIFKSESPHLSSQYYTIIQIGGAHAYIFFPFMNFLELPTLIITDIDSIDKGRKSSLVSNGISTSNNTIKKWYEMLKEKEEKITLEEIINLKNEEKTIGNIHIEFQSKEKNICARSFEQAIINVNRNLFDLTDKNTEQDIDNYNYGKKTDFAIKLLINPKSFVIPKYIKDGLIWLDIQ